MRRARVAFSLVLATGAAWAQENAPAGFLKGDFVSATGTLRSGQFIFQSGGNRFYSCTYDDKTFVERENRLINIGGARTGDRLQIVSDNRADSAACYARLVHILDTKPIYAVPGVRPRAQPPMHVAEPFGPRGNLTLSGLVMGVETNLLILKSRAGKYQTIHLRPDTRYAAEGQTAQASSLRRNTIVFVRCGRTLENKMEAYQVVWGAILKPEE